MRPSRHQRHSLYIVFLALHTWTVRVEFIGVVVHSGCLPFVCRTVFTVALVSFFPRVLSLVSSEFAHLELDPAISNTHRPVRVTVVKTCYLAAIAVVNSIVR